MARTQFRQLGKLSDILQAGEAAAYLVRTLIMMDKKSDQILSLVQEAQTDLRGDRAGSAPALAALGHTHYIFRQEKQALKELETARATLEKFGCFEDVTYCLFWMSYSHFALGDLQNCLRACEKGLELSKQAELDGRICEFSTIFVGCHIRLEHYDEALKLCRDVLPLSEAQCHSSVTALILEVMGYILATKKEYEGALLAYSRARTKYYNMDKVDASTTRLTRCDHNISQIDQAKGGKGQVVLEFPD
jgi:tetratricopeptide (TPR) repeat protein